MHPVQMGLWDPRPPSKNATAPRAPPPVYFRHPHVTTAVPAKRITFFRSGDNQFGGVRMAIHKRSFKCFDALLDDLTQKVPLPFGVRTITTPRGTHAIKHLEQLQDGGCYVCSDQRQVKPINMDLANRPRGIWVHHGRRPHRPETSSVTPPGHSHLPLRPRRVLLVKNSEPGMRRSIVLNKRSTRSLRAFLEEVSEVMEFHVRKLYTAEGRRIDSVQSLVTCPGVLVCVGREAFSPMLINFIRKTSEEKLPGLYRKSPGLGPRTPGNGARSPGTHGVRSPPHGAQSRASEYDEQHESKKNVNFGLETRKSIIHPRSDSSNRSTRFSVSSEKSYGLSSQARPAIMNDDIEKRVLVNKDGSVSVEMRVRFRLQNDETVQWSTQIKRSPSLTNESSPLSQAQPHYLQQGQSESYSDPDSTPYRGVDNSSQPVNFALEENHCPCCYHKEERPFDLWENPIHTYKRPPVPPPHPSSHPVRHTHSSSSSSSCNSRRVLRCRAQLSRSPGESASDHSQLVQEEMCVTEQVERRVEVAQHGDTQVEVCKVSRCCSRTEVVAMDTSLRPHSTKSAEGELTIGEDDNRPVSAVSISSHVLQSLKEDQDDEEEDELPPSASQCCHRNEPSPSPSHATLQDDKPASNVSVHSGYSAESKSLVQRGGSRTLSAVSSCHCGKATPHSTADADAASTISNVSQSRIPKSEEDLSADVGDEDVHRVTSGLSGCSSQRSVGTGVCSHCGACKRTSNSRASRMSDQASSQPTSPPPVSEKAEDGHDDAASDVSVESTQSNKTNRTDHECQSALEERAQSVMSRTSNLDLNRKENERAPSAASATSQRSNKSHKSGSYSIAAVTADKENERSLSALSSQSNLSAKSGMSHKSKCNTEAFVHTSKEEAEEENTVERTDDSFSDQSAALVKTQLEKEETDRRTHSSLSVKSDASAKSGKAGSVLSHKSAQSSLSKKSGTSCRSTCSHCSRVVAPGDKAEDEPMGNITGEEGGAEEDAGDRAASVMSAKSNLSANSNKSRKSNKASEICCHPRSEAEGETEERATSQMSGKLSVKSKKSSKCNDNEKASSPNLTVDAGETESKITEVETQERSGSMMSNKSASSAKSNRAKPQEDRSPSAASGQSQMSAKSKKSNHSKGFPDPDDAVDNVTETNAEEKEDETPDRSESALSVKLESSVGSHKSNSARNHSSPNLVTIKTPYDEENGIQERAQSALSGKLSIASAASLKPGRNGTAVISVIETTEAGENVDNSAPKNQSSEHSHGQTLSPRRTASSRARSPKASAASPRPSRSPAQQLLDTNGLEETRGPSALSAHSRVSAHSSRSSCRRCGGAKSPLENAKKKKEGEDAEGEKSDETSERPVSILSSSSKRQRKESGGTEQPLSRASSGSVSLGLPEDQEAADSDSGKSTVSFSNNTEKKAKSSVKTATPDVSKSPEQGERTGSIRSEKSNSHSRKSDSCHNHPGVDIPIIEMPKGSEDGGEEGREQNTERALSAITVKSGKSQRACSNCSVKSAARMVDKKTKDRSGCSSPITVTNGVDAESVKSTVSTKACGLDASTGRTSSAKSESLRGQSKSPASARVKNAKVAGSVSNGETENQDTSRAGSKAQEKEDTDQNKAPSVSSKRSCCLSPEVAPSTHSESKKSSKKSQGIATSAHKAKSNAGSDCGSATQSSCHLHSPRPSSKIDASSESTLSHSLSAADLLKETMAAARQHSQQSRSSKTSERPKSEKRIRNLKDHGVQELTPACLPNASPNEVVSDWLRSIPADSSMLAACSDEEAEQTPEEMEETTEEGVPKEEESAEDQKVDMDKKVGPQEEENQEGEAKCAPAEEEKSSGPTLRSPLRTSSSSLSKNWQFSAAVMKVLLSSSLGRCRSMPEVSPVYGRRLSTSAQGLLDCLAQLQLIEPTMSCNSHQLKDHKQKYDEIMGVLQSLWLTEPRDIATKDAKEEQVTPPRSSSGVGMSSGSGGSGKDNGNQVREETPPKENEPLHEEEEVAKVSEEDEGNAKAIGEETEAPKDVSKAETAEEVVKREEEGPVSQSPDSPKATENPSSSDKSSTNNSSKSATDNEREMQDDSQSGTPPAAPRASLSKRLSQDPDPVWVLHLLKKLEKQFMSHYIKAMAEFKVRWDLDDNVILDTMISELRDEVSRRIQSSVEREMRKINSRAGKVSRSPRPPQLANISRESTMTEKRRRILMVMKNQSVKTADSVSDEEMTGEFSDQRSEDEYCPCDACVRKKMAARPFKKNPLAAEAPMMMEFDLLKILQLKKSPSPAPVKVIEPEELEDESMVEEEEGRNLEVVKEEEEEDETKEDIRADVVLEETIPEEDEELEEENDEAKGEVNEDEEQQEGVTSVDEAEQDETSENGDEEEGSGECTCHSGRDEEDSNNEGEDAEDTSNYSDDAGETGEGETGGNEAETGTGGEGEGSDTDIAKEATAGEDESGDDSSAKNTANEESTPVEEAVEGNSASAEAEDEDEGDDDTGAGESHGEENGEESEEQEGKASEEDRASSKSRHASPAACVTEGEEADAEDSEDSKHRSDTGAEESGREEVDGTGGEEEKESGEDGDEEATDEDAVEAFKPEEKSEEKPSGSKKENGTVLHQFTKASVESQPGSMEDVDRDSPSNLVHSIKVPKKADGVSTGGVVGSKRSRSPGRVKAAQGQGE
ncbi:retinitis pigmentosa 1-like 1 protein isoform X2 [Cololabis saira]|uniref:retinitis pigmentosa 1-like 1 protein isoform X2 n=1 Tax=Cololabis saira TaxID=129043 RepID=UPI002AD236BE|nr:retinitis pigmentosa 1-like 1 protein isoform X2 [Cololabis saira]